MRIIITARGVMPRFNVVKANVLDSRSYDLVTHRLIKAGQPVQVDEAVGLYLVAGRWCEEIPEEIESVMEENNDE